MAGEKNTSKSIALILLAAGESSRLGQPKQLLMYGGQTLLQHSLQAARSSAANPVVVVVGAYTNDVVDKAGTNVQIAVNEQWKEGMASSIRCGIEALLVLNSSSEGVILMVCDQPFVTSALLDNLMTTHLTTGKRIIACSYDNTYGPPALFHKDLFPELLQLSGDVGAKSVIKQHANDVEIISFPKGSIDIDTKADYQKLSKANSEQ